MERACKLIRGMRLLTTEELACAGWAEAVGKRIAAHTRAVRMVRGRLIVEVEDHIWQHQLFALQRQVLGNLANIMGAGLVEELEFRVLPRRRQPQRAEQSAPGFAVDDADDIADPVLRSLYRASRDKARA
jgi:predicted nucleic acid-binding Zn ribbon protein